MFLGGSDGQQAELRSPAFRGGLRFWYRAYLGGQGITDTGRLSEEETKVFGSASKGGLVSVFIKHETLDTISAEKYTKNEKGKPLPNGTAYLWYSLTLGQNKKQGIKPGQRFYVSLRSKDADALESAMLAFRLLAQYGGLGSRSRRAAGSFRIVNTKANYDVSKSDFDLNTLPDSPLPQKPSFNVYHAEYCEIHNLNNKSFNSWERAVEHVGTQMRSYRSKNGMGKGGDYDQVRDQIQHNAPAKALDRAHFGLPLRFQYRSLKGKVNKNNVNIDIYGGGGENRKASPVLLSINKQNEEYFISVIYFKSQFFPPKGGMKIGYNKNVKLGNSSIISDFIKTL